MGMCLQVEEPVHPHCDHISPVEEAVILFECSLAAVDVSSNNVGWLSADADLSW
jgi:hypothetical protein